MPSGQRERFGEAVRLIKAMLQQGTTAGSGACGCAPAEGLFPGLRQSCGIPAVDPKPGSRAGFVLASREHCPMARRVPAVVTSSPGVAGGPVSGVAGR